MCYLIGIVSRSLVVASYNPVAAENAMSSPASEDRPRTLRTVYEYNENVVRISDWSEPYLSLQSLSQNNIAISIDAFVVLGEKPVPSPYAGDRRRRTIDMED